MSSVVVASWVPTSYLVSTCPLVIVVVPLTPDDDAVHVLFTASAMTGPGPTPRGVPTAAELVTVPPGTAWVRTEIGPEGGATAFESALGYLPLKILAGPYSAVAPSSSAAEMGVAEPPAGSVTDGEAPVAAAP